MYDHILNILRDEQLQVSLGYPDHIVVRPLLTRRGAWAFGTANPTWMGDYLIDGLAVRHVDLGIPSDSQDNAAIAAAILGVLRTPHKRDTATAGELLDILQRAQSVIEESEGADEHGELLYQLGSVVELLTDEIDASHMGTGADVAVIQRGDQ